jgi:hypothetical protein
LAIRGYFLARLPLRSTASAHLGHFPATNPRFLLPKRTSTPFDKHLRAFIMGL